MEIAVHAVVLVLVSPVRVTNVWPKAAHPVVPQTLIARFLLVVPISIATKEPVNMSPLVLLHATKTKTVGSAVVLALVSPARVTNVWLKAVHPVAPKTQTANSQHVALTSNASNPFVLLYETTPAQWIWAMTPPELKRYMEAIYIRCYRILGDKELAWDALQEVMTCFYEASKKQRIDKPLHYLYRSCTHLCIKVLKKERRFIPSLPSELESFMEGSVPKAEWSLLVSELVNQLEEEELQLLLYRYVDQMTLKEIAALYEMTDRGVKKRIDKVELRVRHYLKEEL